MYLLLEIHTARD